jgi:hypothetical protein
LTKVSKNFPLQSLKHWILAASVLGFFFGIGFVRGTRVHNKDAFINKRKAPILVYVDNADTLPQAIANEISQKFEQRVELKYLGDTPDLTASITAETSPHLLIIKKANALTQTSTQFLKWPDSLNKLLHQDFTNWSTSEANWYFPLFWSYAKVVDPKKRSTIEASSLYHDKIETTWSLDQHLICNYKQLLIDELDLRPSDMDIFFNKENSDLRILPHTHQEATTNLNPIFLWQTVMLVPEFSPDIDLSHEVAEFLISRKVYLKWLLSQQVGGTLDGLENTSLADNRKPSFIRKTLELKNIRPSIVCRPELRTH